MCGVSPNVLRGLKVWQCVFREGFKGVVVF